MARAGLFEGHHLNGAISRSGSIWSSGLACTPNHSACSADGALPQTPPNFRLMWSRRVSAPRSDFTLATGFRPAVDGSVGLISPGPELATGSPAFEKTAFRSRELRLTRINMYFAEFRGKIQKLLTIIFGLIFLRYCANVRKPASRTSRFSHGLFRAIVLSAIWLQMATQRFSYCHVSMSEVYFRRDVLLQSLRRGWRRLHGHAAG